MRRWDFDARWVKDWTASRARRRRTGRLHGGVHRLGLRKIAPGGLVRVQLRAQCRISRVRALGIHVVLADLLAHGLLALAVLHLLLIYLLLELLLVTCRVEDHGAGLGNGRRRCRPGSGRGTGNRCRLRGLGLSQSGSGKACDTKRKRKYGKQELAR